MLNENITRRDFAEKLQEIINRYNSGGASTEDYYQELVDFTENLQQEDERHVREGLTEEELELFDLLKKPSLTKAEEQSVKLAAKSLLQRLKHDPPKVLVQNWHLEVTVDSGEVLNALDLVRKVVSYTLSEIVPP